MSQTEFGDFGRTDLYAPNSDLNSDLANSREYEIMDGKICTIAVNDWLDVLETAMPPDPFWGYSFQVYSVENVTSVTIKAINPVQDFYELVNLDSKLISNVYRRVETIDPTSEE